MAHVYRSKSSSLSVAIGGLSALALTALLAACGGAETVSTSDASQSAAQNASQKDREAAALQRAMALNAEAAGRVKAERAGGAVAPAK